MVDVLINSARSVAYFLVYRISGFTRILRLLIILQQIQSMVVLCRELIHPPSLFAVKVWFKTYSWVHSLVVLVLPLDTRLIPSLVNSNPPPFLLFPFLYLTLHLSEAHERRERVLDEEEKESREAYERREKVIAEERIAVWLEKKIQADASALIDNLQAVGRRAR